MNSNNSAKFLSKFKFNSSSVVSGPKEICPNSNKKLDYAVNFYKI